jgi:hypothetical protein
MAVRCRSVASSFVKNKRRLIPRTLHAESESESLSQVSIAFILNAYSSSFLLIRPLIPNRHTLFAL